MQAVPSTSAKPSAAATTISNTAIISAATKSSPKAVKAAVHSHPHPHSISGAVSDPKREIEEISKKISEHADAIYHTWKSRGLAPTELLEFYTHAAAADASGAGDFFAVATDDTAEGLQKLVNTFVIKDKEQRAAVGVKAIGKGSSGEITEHSNMAGKLKQSATRPAAAQKTAAATAAAIASTKTTTSSAILLKPGEVGRDGVDAVDTLKKKFTKTSAGTKAASSATATATASGAAKTTPTTTSATKALAGGAKTNQCVKVLECGQQQKQQQSQKVCAAASSAASGSEHVRHQPQKLEQAGARAPVEVTSGTATTTATTKPAATATKARITALGKSKAHTAASSPLTLDINLNLDVNDLSELQTHNLRKIKELLQENATTTATSTAPDSAKVKKLQTPVKLGDAKAGTATATAATTTAAATATASASASVVTNHSSRAGLAAKTNNDNNNSSNSKAAAHVLGGESGGGVDGDGDKLAAPIGGASIIADKNSSSGSTRSSGGVSSGSSTTNNNTSHSKSGALLKRSGVTKVSTKLAPDNQAQPPPQSQQQLPQQQQQLQSGGNIRAKDSEKIATRIASNQPANNGSHKPIKIVSKEDNNNNNNHINNDNNNSNSSSSTSSRNKAPTAKKETKATSIAGAVGGGGTDNQMEVGRTNMPAAPTKFAKPGRTLVNGQDKNLGRPILTRGSVAERVLMFEKCPDVRNSFLNIKRPDPADAPPKSLLKVKLHATPPTPQEQNSLQKEFRSNKSVYIPRFYFPHGKPQPTIALERTLRGILGAFDSFPNNQVTKDELPRILKLCGLPFYWRMPVMIFCQQGNSGLVERQRFVEFWKQMNVYCHDAASRFVYILSRGQRFRSYILPEDMAPLVQDVVDTHPGLAFLKEATEFHSRYVHTVIARIFYSVNRSWSGRISISELKKSDLLEIISLLEEEDDINQIMAFFSYEHFYVIYCKFWELDKDHDLLISQEDLARHSDHALSSRIVERIFSGCVTRSDNKKNPDDEPKMSYTDFVWFLLSEEDKRTPTAIEYWFRCMDVNGDGALSMYELEFFYEEQQHRMESIGIETLPFEDCLCQMLDMIKPARRDCITLSDLKRCRMTHVFFDTFFNLEKYLDHEQRDPFASQRDEYASDWDRFAAQEYELLISEENE